MNFYKDDLKAFQAFMKDGGALCCVPLGYYHGDDDELHGLFFHCSLRDATIEALTKIVQKWNKEFCLDQVNFYRTEVFDVGTKPLKKQFETEQQAHLFVVNMAMQLCCD